MKLTTSEIEIELGDFTVDSFVEFLQRHAVGEQNAISRRDICQALDLDHNGDRLLRALAQTARNRGILVCSSNRGYYMAECWDDLLPTIGRIESQIQRSQQALATFKAAARARFFGRPTQAELPMVVNDGQSFQYR